MKKLFLSLRISIAFVILPFAIVLSTLAFIGITFISLSAIIALSMGDKEGYVDESEKEEDLILFLMFLPFASYSITYHIFEEFILKGKIT